MKLASFSWNGHDSIGFAFDNDTIVDLAPVAKLIRADKIPSDMISLIETGNAGRALIQEAYQFARAHVQDVAAIPQSQVRWYPPVRRPAKICGIAMNNSASNARKITAPDHPLFFLKPSSCLIGHNEAIKVHPSYGSVHPEPELAVIIGRHCKYVPASNAMEVVYGYSIIDDLTGNGMRAEDMVHYYALYPSAEGATELVRREQHLSYAGRYKGTDTFGPMGPWLVTKDEIPDPGVLDVSCWHNGELIAEDSTRYYSYPVPEIIAYITRFHSLWPGDIIAMGTAFKPGKSGGRSLHAANITALGGDLKIEISGLGVLLSTVQILSDGDLRPVCE
jgi:2-keto-4-pentenoate hydratase/2-oxohepta-3-ene-1,7-dioic acid hydratase in catechol pathway